MRTLIYYLAFYTVCVIVAVAAFQLMTIPGEATAVALGALIVVYAAYDALNRHKNIK